MGFSAKQVQTLQRSLDQPIHPHARSPMDASSPISKAGTRSRKPTGFLALMAGTGKPWTPVASWHVKTAASFLAVYIGEGAYHRCKPTGRLLFAKAMARAKAVVPRLAKSTILLSRPQKPMPPNVR